MAKKDSKPKTIVELCDGLQAWADSYYVRAADGKPTGEARNMTYALQPLRELAADKPLSALTAELAHECQQWFVDRGLARKTCNTYLKKTRRLLRIAAAPPRRWIVAEVVTDFGLIEPLKMGRTKAHETEGVKCVSWELVEQTMRHALPWLRVMLWVHWWSGMRPSEVISMRKSEIVECDGALIFTPRLHKNSHHGHVRNIVLGERARQLLDPWMAVVGTDKLFHIGSAEGYYQAVLRIVLDHQIEPWAPNQIRHSAATRIREEAGLDVAQAALSHRNASTTEIYAPVSATRAMDVLRTIG